MPAWERGPTRCVPVKFSSRNDIDFVNLARLIAMPVLQRRQSICFSEAGWQQGEERMAGRVDRAAVTALPAATPLLCAMSARVGSSPAAHVLSADRDHICLAPSLHHRSTSGTIIRIMPPVGRGGAGWRNRRPIRCATIRLRTFICIVPGARDQTKMAREAALCEVRHAVRPEGDHMP